MKVIESAREAVAKGMADKEEIQIATNGAEVTEDGNIIPSNASEVDETPRVNGDHLPVKLVKRKRTMDGRYPPHRQDISIHNQHDFDRDD